tara:strand:- start:6711 stop:9248 length:2538 start_codon:yes stop_codon:yes gene_type:complete
MASPIWVTPPGDLGTVVEGEFYQVQLDATNATAYSYLSGVLPSGIRVTSNGIVEGNPRNYDYIQGVPQEVSQDVTSKFVVRATASDGTVADRVFEMTVTGQDAPVIDDTPDSDLGVYFDGDLVDVQLSATDPDPLDKLSWKYQSGDLPEGLTVSSTGRISGYIEPFADASGTPGFDTESVAYDMQPFDFRTVASNKDYEWIVSVSDTKDIDVKNYFLRGLSRNLVTTDLDLVTADSLSTSVTTNIIDKLLDASQTNLRRPALLTETSGLGRITHDNYFSFQFIGKDFDGETIDYILASGSLPTGLTLNTQSGFITGYIPIFSATETDFTFGIKVRKRDNTDYESDVKTFTITVVGEADSVVTWPDADMTIKTGELSQLDVVATISDSRPVQYQLKTGTTTIVAGNFIIGETYTIVTQGTTDFINIGSADNKVGTIFTATGEGAGTGTASLGVNKLPQGLKLNSNGLLIGRVSFETLMFDTGTTTFDINDPLTNQTTFEQVYTFVARVFSADGIVDTYKKFTITVSADSSRPYENLYVRAFPRDAQRDIYDSLIQNSDDIPPEDVYRASDFYFGIQTDLRALVVAGLSPKSETEYISALAQNHWNNTLRFGGFKNAKALNEDGTTKYEVVYVELVDNRLGVDPSTGLPSKPAMISNVSSGGTWTNPINSDQGTPDVTSGNYLASQVNDFQVYQNSIENMRVRLRDEIGFQILERKALPEWMVDKQDDNTILGWTLACPIVYCKPGAGDKIKYRLNQRTSINLQDISFEVDRFILDNNMSKWYSKSGSAFIQTEETTFDKSISLTTFDGKGTRFFSSIDTYAEKDEGDLFIKFPQVGPFDRLPTTNR